MSELGSNKPKISTKPGFDRYDCADICALPRPPPTTPTPGWRPVMLSKFSTGLSSPYSRGFPSSGQQGRSDGSLQCLVGRV